MSLCLIKYVIKIPIIINVVTQTDMKTNMILCVYTMAYKIPIFIYLKPYCYLYFYYFRVNNNIATYKYQLN